MSVFVNPDVALLSAFRSGDLVGCLVRPVRRSGSGVGLVLVFASLSAAGAFAAATAAELGKAVDIRFVRRASGALGYGVVAPVAGSLPFCSTAPSPSTKAPAYFVTAWAIPDASALPRVGDGVARTLL